jgi:hypothetical protein
VATNPGASNLVSWWALNETSGNRADSHGSETLTDNNTVLYAAGKKGNAADFERDNSESLSKADDAALSLVGSWTIAGWINIETAPTLRAGLVHKFGNVSISNGYGIYIEVVSSSLYVHAHVGGNSTALNVAHTASALSASTWYFVYGKWDDGADTLYAGVNADTATSGSGGVTTLADNASILALGANLTGGQYFDGLMDEVCLYSRALSADEIAWLYNSGSGRTYAELTATAVPVFDAHYRMRRAQ